MYVQSRRIALMMVDHQVERVQLVRVMLKRLAHDIQLTGLVLQIPSPLIGVVSAPLQYFLDDVLFILVLIFLQEVALVLGGGLQAHQSLPSVI